MKISKNIC